MKVSCSAPGHWALLITRDTTHGRHSAQIGWSEGRLYDLLDGASLATLSNVQQDDETLPAFERTALEAMMEPIEAVLRLPGCSPDTFDDVDDEGSTVPHNAPRSSTTSASRDVLADSGLSP